MIPVLLFLTAVIFILNSVSPIDPARAVLRQRGLRPAGGGAARGDGLNDPLPTQYVDYLQGILEGDLGTSARLAQPVTEGLSEAFPNTLELAAVALVLTVVFGTLMDSPRPALARREDPAGDHGRAAPRRPTFLLGIAGILIFFSALDWLPASGTTSYDNAPDGPTGFLLVDSLIAGGRRSGGTGSSTSSCPRSRSP